MLKLISGRREPSDTLRKRDTGYASAFVVAFLTVLFAMAPFVLLNKGYFLLYGDFNVQQYPFYMHTHDAIQNGALGWDFKTDLGANFIGSYSFYNLGSPFFWLTLLLPSRVVPYLIGPLLALKIGLCSLNAYAYLRRFTREHSFALLGALMYALSGFSLFNIFFNHFHEPMVFFPLLLIALEELMQNNRRGVFVLTVCLNAVVNYFFFTGEVVFVVLYFLVRLFSGCWSFSMKKYAVLCFEAVLGLCLGAFLLLPSIDVVLQNPRTDSFLYGWSALLYGNSQRYLNILESLFFPPDLPARPNFTPDSGANWGSIAAYLPLFGMTGVIAFLKSRTGHWLKRFLVILGFFAFIPILNASFVLFNNAYYARWFYMLTLMTALATVLALSSRRTSWGSGLKWSWGITLAIALGIGLTVRSISSSGEKSRGLYEYSDRFWVYVAIALVALGVVTLVIWLLRRKRSKEVAVVISLCGVVALSVVTWVYFIAEGSTLSYNNRDYVVPYALSRGEEVELPEGEKENAQAARFRIDVYNGMDNMGLFWDMPSINFFHSIVPASVMDFYPAVGVERGVATRPGSSVYALRSLLSVKYLFDDASSAAFGSTQPVSSSDAGVFSGGEWQYTDPDGYLVTVEPESSDEALGDFVPNERQQSIGSDYETVMPGYSYISTSCGHNLWRNDYYIPMGFAYDKYILEDDLYTYTDIDRGNVLLKALCITKEQERKYSGLLRQLKADDTLLLTPEAYFADCRARSEECCSSYLPDKDGFTASISLKRENLVFFSVPYDKGFSATVNGEPAAIERVNIGFMAVLCPAGESEIRFTYKTPLLEEGILVTFASIIILILYVIMVVRPRLLAPALSGMWRACDRLMAVRPLKGLAAQEEQELPDNTTEADAGGGEGDLPQEHAEQPEGESASPEESTDAGSRAL